MAMASMLNFPIWNERPLKYGTPRRRLMIVNEEPCFTKDRVVANAEAVGEKRRVY